MAITGLEDYDCPACGDRLEALTTDDEHCSECCGGKSVDGHAADCSIGREAAQDAALDAGFEDYYYGRRDA